jgi:hypothetical protein
VSDVADVENFYGILLYVVQDSVPTNDELPNIYSQLFRLVSNGTTQGKVFEGSDPFDEVSVPILRVNG